MLKIHPEFGIYALSFKKAVKGLIQAGFFSPTPVKSEDYAEFTQHLCDTGTLKYHKVTLHTAPIDGEVFVCYDVEGETDPMSIAGLLYEYKYSRRATRFVAICHKGANGELELTGFVC